MSRKLFIIVEECAQTKEAYDIFRRRGWSLVSDKSIPLPGRRQTRKAEHATSQINLDIEEWEYGGQEQ